MSGSAPSDSSCRTGATRTRECGGDQRVRGLEIRRWCAASDKQVDDRAMTTERRRSAGGATVVEGRDEVDTVIDE
jgi:hypothetical protein